MISETLNGKKWFSVVGAGIALSCGAFLIWKLLHSSPEIKKEERDEKIAPEARTSEERQKVLSMASHLKTKANAFFQEGKFDNALQMYEETLTLLSYIGDDEESVGQQHIIRSNAVMCFYKLQRYQEACLVATELLEEHDSLPLNLKAKILYRRGLASKALGNGEGASLDFQAAIHFSPGNRNPEAERELKLLINQ